MSVQLARFFFFNPTLSKSETDTEKKILYYYPSSIPVFDQAQSVGLIQGISGFTQAFCPDETCQALITKKHKLSFYSPEPDFFACIMVEAPKTTTQDKTAWHERELEPEILKHAVRRTYETFRLVHGSMTQIMALEGGVDQLKQKLDSFMTSYIPALNMTRYDVFSMLDGVSFLPMERREFLAANCFLNEAEQAFPALWKSAFFVRDNLVCTTMDVALLLPVCHYLFHFPGNKMQMRSDLSTAALLGLSHRNQCVHIGEENVYLLVFKVGAASVVFFSRSLDQSSEMLQFVSSKVQGMVVEMEHTYDKMMKADGPFRFVYYNRMNRALKSAFGGTRRIARDTLHVIADMHTSLASASEIVARHGGTFVLGKKVQDRELFAIFESANDTLLEVEQQVHNLTQVFFSNIYF